MGRAASAKSESRARVAAALRRYITWHGRLLRLDSIEHGAVIERAILRFITTSSVVLPFWGNLDEATEEIGNSVSVRIRRVEKSPVYCCRFNISVKVLNQMLGVA